MRHRRSSKRPWIASRWSNDFETTGDADESHLASPPPPGYRPGAMRNRPAARRSAEVAAAERASGAPFAGLLAGLVIAVVLLHLPSFTLPHVEGDEVVF